MTLNPDDLEAMLAARRAEAVVPPPPADAAWRLAAGEPVPPALRRDVLHDAASLRELAVAQALLEVRGRPHADAERSADAVLARLRANRQRRWFRQLGGLAAVAVAAALWIFLQAPAALRWAPVDVVAVAARGTTELSFRVEVVPAVTCHAAVWVVATGDGPVVQRLYPLTAEQATAPTFAGWPNGRWPAGQLVRLPPAGSEPFRVPAAGAFLVLVQAPEPLDSRLEELTTLLTAAVPEPTAAGAPLQALTALQQLGLTVAVQTLRAP